MKTAFRKTLGAVVYAAGLVVAISATLDNPPEPWAITAGFVAMIVGYVLQEYEPK